MPFDWAAPLWRFHIELSAVLTDIRTDELGNDAENAWGTLGLVIHRMLFGRHFQAAQARFVQSMSWLKVEHVSMSGNRS